MLAFAKEIAEKANISIVFYNGTPRTDGKTIFLPATAPAEKISRLTASLVHEAYHIRSTNFKIGQKITLELNVLEDVRINVMSYKELPNLAGLRAQARARFFKEHPIDSESPLLDLSKACIFYGERKYLPVYDSYLTGPAREFLIQYQRPLDAIFSQVYKARGTKALLPLADQLKALWIEFLELNPEPAPDQVEPDEPEESAPETGTAPEPDPDQDQADEPEESAPETGTAPETDPDQDQTVETGQTFDYPSEEYRAEYLARGRDFDGFGSYVYSPLEPGENLASEPLNLNHTELVEIFRSINENRAESDSGTVNPDRLHLVYTEPDRLFITDSFSSGVNTLVAIQVDASGSMNRKKLVIAAAAVNALTGTLDYCRQSGMKIDYQVSTFNYASRIIKEFGADCLSPLEPDRNFIADGDTEPDLGWPQIREAFESAPRRTRKILFIITDGLWNSWRYLDLLKFFPEDVTLLPIGIHLGSQEQYYVKLHSPGLTWIFTEKRTELEDTLIAGLQTALV
jgi:hypothetical protein